MRMVISFRFVRPQTTCAKDFHSSSISKINEIVLKKFRFKMLLSVVEVRLSLVYWRFNWVNLPKSEQTFFHVVVQGTSSKSHWKNFVLRLCDPLFLMVYKNILGLNRWSLVWWKNLSYEIIWIFSATMALNFPSMMMVCFKFWKNFFDTSISRTVWYSHHSCFFPLASKLIFNFRSLW